MSTAGFIVMVAIGFIVIAAVTKDDQPRSGPST
jgi:hypothetical protein